MTFEVTFFEVQEKFKFSIPWKTIFAVSRAFLDVILSRESRSGNGEVRRQRKPVSYPLFVDESTVFLEVATFHGRAQKKQKSENP